MKRIRYIWLLMILLVTSSCGELFTFNENDSDPPEKIMLSKNEVDIMVGDSIFFQAQTAPAHVAVTYKWDLKGDTAVYDWRGYWFHAVKPGKTTIHVEARNVDAVGDSIPYVEDECEVRVFEWIDYEYPNDFLYETVVYASLKIEGEEVTDTIEGLHVVAIVDDRVRCRAKFAQAFGKSYYVFRIGSFWPGEVASLQCYHHGLYRRYDLKEITLNGSTYGTLSNLVQLTEE